MQKAVRLIVEPGIHPPGRIEGFRFLWAFYVSGFRPDRHCQPCFRGRRVAEFATGTARSGHQYVFDQIDRYPYLYICGVGAGPVNLHGERNLHLPLEYCEGASVERTTWNGYRIRVDDARELPIPPLPDGWRGLGPEFTRCRNYRFGVAYFGG